MDRELAEQFYEENQIPLPSAEEPEKEEKPLVEIPSETASTKDEDMNKENEMMREERLRSKRVRFNDIDEDGATWQDTEIENLTKKVKELETERNRYKRMLDQTNYEEIIRENELMKAELKSMYILLDENK